MSDTSADAADTIWSRLAAIGLVGTLLLLPFEVGWVLDSVAGTAAAYNRVVIVTPFDFMLLLLVIGAIPGLVERIRTHLTLGVITASVLLAGAALAFVFHPSERGVMVLLRLVALLVLVVEMVSLTREQFRTRVAIPLMTTASLQTLLGFAQMIKGSPLGLSGWGEQPELRAFGDAVGASGTTLSPYILAGLGVLAATVGLATLPQDRRRPWWLAGIGLSFAALSITYSRASLVGVVVIFAALLIGSLRSRPDLRAPLAVMLLALVLPALVFNDGWVTRAEDSATTDVDDFATFRITHIEQSLTVIAAHPVVGAGPGLYSYTLERDHDPEIDDAVHVVPLLVAAEDGLPIGIVFTLLLVVLALRALRTSPEAVAVVAGFGTFLLFDKFAYLHPNGMVMLAVWLATIDRLTTPQKMDQPLPADIRQ